MAAGMAVLMAERLVEMKVVAWVALWGAGLVVWWAVLKEYVWVD